MQQSGTKTVATRRNAVPPGSVWETRMKLDQVKGGVKVYSTDDDASSGGGAPSPPRPRTSRVLQSPNACTTEKRKRRNWTAPEPADKNPPSSVLRKTQSEPPSPAPKENCRELGEGKSVVRSLSSASIIPVVEPPAPPSAPAPAADAGEDQEVRMEVDEEEGFEDKEVDLHAGEEEAVDEDDDEEEEGEEIGEEDKKIDQIYEAPCSASDDAPLADADAPDPEEIPDSALVIAHQIPVAAVVEHQEEHGDGGGYYQHYSNIPLHHNRMQSLVDLVMWRDISRTAFVFGTGTFLVISSSYTKDISFSVTSAISYLGLVYLAVIFLFNCILHREGVGVSGDGESDRRWLVGEDEAIWLIRMLLPYINEILLKLRALFSGDPATTMKLAVFLFALARCGGSITFGTMAKMAFFGAFTVPKLLSAHSHHIARYGKFWLERFSDAWDSCTHKKAVAFGVFTLVWNLSSVVARVWALFMLVVALRYYQLQRTETEGSCDTQDDTETEDEQHRAHQQQEQKEQQQQQKPQLRQWRRGGTEASKSVTRPSPHKSNVGSGARVRAPLESIGFKERKKA